MRISRAQLEALILEELREALEYPADEMAAITATIFSLADNAGIETTPDEREAMVDELESLLRAEGYSLHEQNLMLGEPLNISLEGTTLYNLMTRIGASTPGAWNKMVKAFERGGINTGLSLDRPGAEEEEEEDQTDTVALPPVEPPPEEIEELQVGDIIDVEEAFGTKAAKKHILHKMLKPGSSHRVDSVDYDEDSPLVITNLETDRGFAGLRHEDFLDYPEFFTVRQADDEEDEDLVQTTKVPPVDAPEEEDDDEDYRPTEEEDDDEDYRPTEEEIAAVKVGDIIRRRDVDLDDMDPTGLWWAEQYEVGDYEITRILEVPQAVDGEIVPNLKVARVVRLDEDGEPIGEESEIPVEDLLMMPDIFKINPFRFPKIKNPWATKWFWERGEEEEEQPEWLKKAAKSIRSMLGGSSTSIKVLGGLTGVAGIVGLMKYLAKDEEKVDEAEALKKGAELEELGEISPKNDFGFITSTLRFLLSLSLDKEQMKIFDLVAEAIRLALVWRNDPRSAEFDEEVSKALDKIPGIEWLDKSIPGGREKVIGVVRERWDDMTLYEKIRVIVALLPQPTVEYLEALIPGPDMSEMDMRWPETEAELQNWLRDTAAAGTAVPTSLPGVLFAAAEMFGLLDKEQARMATNILVYTHGILRDAKDDSQLERLTKIMDSLFEHQKQLNRMKVLAGVK